MPLRLFSDYCNLWVIRNVDAARSTDKAQKFGVIWIQDYIFVRLDEILNIKIAVRDGLYSLFIFGKMFHQLVNMSTVH